MWVRIITIDQDWINKNLKSTIFTSFDLILNMNNHANMYITWNSYRKIGIGSACAWHRKVKLCPLS